MLIKLKNKLKEDVLWDRTYYNIYDEFKEQYETEDLNKTLEKGCKILDELKVNYG